MAVQEEQWKWDTGKVREGRREGGRDRGARGERGREGGREREREANYYLCYIQM